MSNRRQFLKNLAGASAGAVIAGCGLVDATRMFAQAAGAEKHKPTMVGKRRIKTVDVHCHVTVPEVRDFLKGTKLERNGGGGGGGYDDTGLSEARLQAMDAMGIDVQAVSINPFWYSAEESLAHSLIDLQNEKLAAMVAARPDRFVAFASVALQFPELAAKQLEEGVKRWGLRGAAIGDSLPGEELSSPKYDSFWAKAEELQSLIFVHPQDSANSTGIRNRVMGSGALGNVIGNPLETTIFLSHMIFDGTLDRFPNLKICAAHAGGYLVAYPDRMDHGCLVFPQQCKTPIKKHPSEYLKQIYVDSLAFTPEGLRHLIAVVGADQIGLGTDYPFPWSATPVDQVMALPNLSDADRIAILGGNICKLLKIPMS
jgi:aminocarboxymuconate-semialdehyde decarboxylase